MNKTKIEWCDQTWNPVTGCYHNCPYCYARRIAKRFGGYTDAVTGVTLKHAASKRLEVLEEPLMITDKNGKPMKAPFPYGFAATLHKYRLDEPARAKKPQTIFVCSMADLFGDWVPDEWIQSVFSACKAAPQHRYLFLTKNPWRYAQLELPGYLPDGPEFYFGTTLADQNKQTVNLFSADKFPPYTFLSIEPLTEPIDLTYLVEGKPDWVIIGAMTGPGSKKKQPKLQWIHQITAWARGNDIPVFMKDSLIPIVGEEGMRREFPWKD